MNVWGYWKCESCGTVNRGDVKHCPNCAAPIPPGTKFFIDPNQIEQVSKDQESKEANWICEYCNAQNSAADQVCRNCASLKSVATMDYFGNDPNQPQEPGGGAKAQGNAGAGGGAGGDPGNPGNPGDPGSPGSPGYGGYGGSGGSGGYGGNGGSGGDGGIGAVGSFASGARPAKKMTKGGVIGAIIGFILIAICCCGLLKFFWPVTKESNITGFGWERSIAVDEYKESRESDWSMPSGATLISSSEEIRSYDHVLDHYEEKSREVAVQVQDGYRTEYRDLGNGQFEEYEVPVYKTEYKTEYYQDPVYVDVPVYDTKYYYSIGRWQRVSSINTSGNDQNPYWGETKGMTEHGGDGDKSISYGTKALGSRSEKYWVTVEDKKGKVQKVEYSYEEWTLLKLNQSIQYKTFWFSNDPID